MDPFNMWVGRAMSVLILFAAAVVITIGLVWLWELVIGS